MNKKFLLSVMAVFVLLVSGCVPESQPVSTETSVPTETVFTAIVNPTSTPGPTQTATPIPDWVTSFAEPILKAIADRPPTYQDDFSNPQSGWYDGATSGQPNVLIAGEKGYFEGEYRIVANAATSEQPMVCSGVEDHNVSSYGDFVTEFDVRFVSGEDGDWEIQFHRNDTGLLSFEMSHGGSVSFYECSPQTGPGCGEIVRSAGNPLHTYAWNHILLIVRGAIMAAYVNGVPILYTEGNTYADEYQVGYFMLNACNAAYNPIETRWDNFKVWDISNLP
jgi:hypothetical protein